MSGALGRALEAEGRWGDPNQEGVVFPRVAEVGPLVGPLLGRRRRRRRRRRQRRSQRERLPFLTMRSTAGLFELCFEAKIFVPPPSPGDSSRYR